MASLSDIERQTKEYADSYNKLSDKLQELRDDLDAAKKKHLHHIKSFAVELSDKLSTLKQMIEKSPELFTKPRTLTFHGIKVGFNKSTESIDWADDTIVVNNIRKHFPELADTLIKTTNAPIKDAMKTLTNEELKKVGAERKTGEDKVVVKSTINEIDKLVNKIVADTGNDDMNVITNKAA